MDCKKCGNSSCIKKGKRNGKQRYFCKNCQTSFQDTYTYNACKNSTNSMIKSLLKEGCGIRSIGRILKISKQTVLSRILKISNRIQAPKLDQQACSYEVDELWSFIGSKSCVSWVTYAIEKSSGKVIDFIVGNKTKANIKPLIDKLLLLEPKNIYTDGLNIYPSLIPKEIHKRFQYCTNRIERMNLNLRTHIKRLSRKTICFSRNSLYLEAHLKIYFWG